jgi:pimeloyl-ACP methyl ester carboxylesterase
VTSRLLVLALSASAPLAVMRAPVQAQLAARDTAFVTPLEFLSAGTTIRGTAYITSGDGPHPTIVRLLGFPGNRAAAFEQYFQSEGFNTIVINFRGQLASDGLYTLDGTPDDAAAALAHIRSESVRHALRIDPTKIVLVGASAGSYAALRATARDPALRCVVLIVPFDFAVVGRAAGTDSTLQRLYGATIASATAGPQPVIRADPNLASMLFERSASYDLRATATALGNRNVYMVGAQNDQSAPVAQHFYPLAASLRAAQAAVHDTVVPDTHTLPVTAPVVFASLASWLRHDCWQ